MAMNLFGTYSRNVESTRNAFGSGLLDLLQGMLAVLRFQMKIKDQLDALTPSLECSDMIQDDQNISNNGTVDADYVNIVREKANESASDLKTSPSYTMIKPFHLSSGRYAWKGSTLQITRVILTEAFQDKHGKNLSSSLCHPVVRLKHAQF